MRDKRAMRRALGRNVKQLRNLRGLSQESLAEVSGRTTRYIGQVERGEISPSFEKLVSIAEGLAVGLGQLYPSIPRARKGMAYLVTPRQFDQIELTWRMLARAKRRRGRVLSLSKNTAPNP